MGPILQHVRPHDVFDTATLTVLAEAYDKALASVQDDHGQPAVVREVIARHILDLAATGEREVNVLCQEALIAWGTFRKVSNGAASPSSSTTDRKDKPSLGANYEAPREQVCGDPCAGT